MLRRAGMVVAATALMGVALAPAATATYPGENGPIVWNNNTSGGDIWIMDPDGSNRDNLTDSNTIGDERPAISPDGAKVAYMSFRQPNGDPGNTEIYVMNSDGSNPTPLTDSASNFEATPYWSKDSQKIVWLRQTPQQDIWRMDANGGNKTNLTNTENAYEAHPEYSPDGSKIVFVNSGHVDNDPESDYQTNNIWVMDADGSNPTQLTFDDFPAGNIEPTWSPDGSTIAWTHLDNAGGAANNTDGVWTMGADGDTPAPANNTSSVDVGNFPVWSPDGTLLAETVGSHIVTATPTTSPVYTSLTTGLAGQNDYPSWAPAGGGGSAPDTKITDKPGDVIHKAKATYKFKALPADGATFECSLDGKPFKPCESPKTYKNLDKGKHRFKVRAVNGGGTDPSPARDSFKVKP